MKKVFIFIALMWSFVSISLAWYPLSEEDKVFEQKITDKIINAIESKENKIKSANLVINKLEKYKKNLRSYTRKEAIISNLVSNLKEKYYKNFDLEIIRIDNAFTNYQIVKLLQDNKEDILKNDNIFLFRYKLDLWLNQVKFLNEKLKELNPKVRIFVDQEWWYVNRFREFEGDYTLWKMIRENWELFDLYNSLSADTKWKIHRKTSWRKYFMSMEEVSEIYKSLPRSEKNNFLKFIAEYRVLSLKNAWFNTVPLVLDLNYWNPVIKDLDRSFWVDMSAYKRLWSYYVESSGRHNMSLYLKHFPGHWKWTIDTHKWVLKYSEDDLSYLNNNLEVFDYVIKYAEKEWVEVWVMVWHFILPTKIKYRFYSILSRADYVMTDDLSMEGYKLASKETLSEDEFFSTKDVMRMKKLIKVYTWVGEIK